MKKLITCSLAVSLVAQSSALAGEQSRTAAIAAETAIAARSQIEEIREKLTVLDSNLAILEKSVKEDGANIATIGSLIAIVAGSTGLAWGKQPVVAAVVQLLALLGGGLSQAGVLAGGFSKIDSRMITQFYKNTEIAKAELLKVNQQEKPLARKLLADVDALERFINDFNNTRKLEIAVDILTVVASLASEVMIFSGAVKSKESGLGLLGFTVSNLVIAYRKYEGTSPYRERMLEATARARQAISEAKAEL